MVFKVIAAKIVAIITVKQVLNRFTISFCWNFTFTFIDINFV